MWDGNSWRNDTNVILADEMGLGKTVQSVSMLGFLQVRNWLCAVIFYLIFALLLELYVADVNEVFSSRRMFK